MNLFQAIKKKFLFILLISIIGSLIGLMCSVFDKPTYKASLNFVLEESSSSGLNAYAGIASQFGIDIGSSSGGGAFQGDNIIELFKSRLFIEKTLQTEYDLKKTLADVYFEISDLRKRIVDENININGLSFSKQTFLRDSILGLMYKEILLKNLVVVRKDKKLSYIEVSFTSSDQIFSKKFTEGIVSAVTSFYKETKTQRSKSNVDKLEKRANELLAQLNNKTFEAASVVDVNVNPTKRVAIVPTELRVRDKTVLLTLYTEVAKSLELARVSLMQETPIIQIVDSPILPLEKTKLRKITGLFFGGVTAFIFAIIIVAIIGMTSFIKEREQKKTNSAVN